MMDIHFFSRLHNRTRACILIVVLLVSLVGCSAAQPPEAALVATATPPAIATPTLAADAPALPTVAPDATTETLEEEAASAEGETTSNQPVEEASVNDAPTAESETSADQPSPDPQSPTPIPTSTPDLPPSELLPLADRYFEVGDYAQAAGTYQFIIEGGGVAQDQLELAWLGLGRSQLEQFQRISALQTFQNYLDIATNPNSRVYFWMAQAESDPSNALSNYQLYLEANPDMGAYVYPLMAERSPESAESFLLNALESDAHYLVLVNIHSELAGIYLEQARYEEAIEQYTAIRSLARTEITRGEMTFLIGQAYLLAGDEESALAAYDFALNNYPTSYATYQGLVALVDAGRPVDDYQRGVVDYYAKAYAPGVDALNSYIANNDPYRADAHLFLAYNYEGLGDTGSALTTIDQYLALDPTNPAVIGTHIEEKVALLTRSVSTNLAIDELQNFARRHPDHPLVPWALYRSGVLADRFRLDPEQAIPLYDRFVATFPEHAQASEALFRNGMMRFEQSNLEAAQAYWTQAADYTDQFGRASLVWLIRTSDAEVAQQYKNIAASAGGSDYYSLRARDIGLGLPAYPPISNIQLEFDEEAAQAEVEAWIRSHFGLADDVPVSSELDPAIAGDPRVIRGEKLWRLGLNTDGKRELEAVREQYAENAQLSYQLSLYFRDIGLYRSSILAASSVMTRAGVSPFEAPSLIGRLAYPIYYNDLIIPEAQQYGYDVLLQFAQIRQESLFESFIASVAAAQGLSQIIPDTGQYIANRLQWPNYQVADLNRPFINLTFGSYYLDQQLDLFEGSIAPALAAYNAGPGNAINWYETAGDDHDLYLETVNFSETRLYIRSIYIGHAIYKHLYGVGDGG